MIWNTRSHQLALSAAVLAACTGPAVPLESYVSESARSACTLLFECCETTRFETIAECEAAMAADLAPGQAIVDASISAGRMRYDGAAARSCLDQSTCDSTPSACSEVLVPLVAEDGECTNSSECISGNCVATAEGSVCRPLPGDGDPCTTACAAGFYCDVFAAAPTCQPSRAAGEACDSSIQCASVSCADGLCVALETPAICRLDG